MTTGVASACPQCGAPLRFGGAASLAVLCSYCRSAVVRSGADLTLAGKVPDLVATDTRLAVGAQGTLQGHAFVVLGRLQLSQGEAVWNEWYASFAGGGWGWLAEAQGRLYATRPIAAEGLPPLEALHPGARLELPGAGSVVVDEVNEARLASFEGELPVRPSAGETWRYADCSTGAGGFATLDYGAGEAPVLYAGREVSYAEAGIADRAPPVAGEEPARALTCPGCGAPVPLRRPDTRACACPSCRRLLDVSGGALRVVGVLEQRSAPPIPLGAKGTLRGEAVEVLGYLVRSVEEDGERYPWQELLLHGPSGYRWLALSEGSWILYQPVAGGRVGEAGPQAVTFDGRTFRRGEGGRARYDEIQGEFYWQIRAGEEVDVEEYRAPPRVLSAERSAHEVAWSLGEPVGRGELREAFALEGLAPGAAALAPNPHAPRVRSAWRVWAAAALVLLALTLGFAVRAAREEVLALDVPLQAGRVTLSPPFELQGGPQAVEIAAQADVSQAWVGLDVAFIEEDTGESETVAFELSHYSGVEDGESWSEGSRRGRAVLGSVADGRYLLRVEPEVERGRGAVPAVAHLRVRRGVVTYAPLVLALLAITVWPVLVSVRAISFANAQRAAPPTPPPLPPRPGPGGDGRSGQEGA